MAYNIWQEMGFKGLRDYLRFIVEGKRFMRTCGEACVKKIDEIAGEALDGKE